MRVRFEKDHDLVEPSKTTEFKAGNEATISKEAFGDLPKGVAVSIENDPPKKEGPSGR